MPIYATTTTTQPIVTIFDKYTINFGYDVGDDTADISSFYTHVTDPVEQIDLDITKITD
jgi:hypothetical protein